MKSFKIFSIIIIALLFLSSFLFAQERIDVIYLNNGDVIKGVIVENVPNNYIKLETPNGSLMTFKYVDIQKFTKEKVDKENINQGYYSKELTPKTTNEYDQNPPVKSTQNSKLTPYTSISIGYGNSYGGYGVKLEHKFETIALHGGIGYFPAPAAFAEATILYSGGVKFFLGSKGLYLNLQFGTIGTEAKELSYSSLFSTTSEVTQVTLYGPSILLGNTYWFSNSVGLNGAIGASYNMVEIEWTDDFTVLFALDLGLTIKL